MKSPPDWRPPRARLGAPICLAQSIGTVMSINTYYDSVEPAAAYALGTTKAIEVCPFHEAVTIRVGDEDAERHAYALATTLLKRDGTYWMREDVMEAIKSELEGAADGECPQCAYLGAD